MINVPIEDVLHVAGVINQIQASPSHDLRPLYVAVDEDRLELRQGTNISYGVRLFEQVNPS